MPKISILMGVYYRREDTALLERSVSSMLAQTERDFELLICDDGSTAEARALLERMAAADSRIRLLRCGDAFSLPRKLNVCLQAAKGDWIARMDDDDFSHPDRLEKQLAYLRAHPELDFVGCNVSLVCAGQPAGQRWFPERPEVRDFYFSQPYIHPTLLFQREALEKVGGYSEDKCCLLCEDYDLLLRLYAAGCRGGNLQEELFDYTIPPDGKGSRRMCHRWNETVTRYRRFKQLGALPKAWPYVLKPLAVGLVPEKLLSKMKENFYDKKERKTWGKM